MLDQRAKTVGLTDFFFRVPSHRVLVAFLFLAGFAGGFLLRFAFEGNFVDALLYGGAEGLVLLSLPALLSAVLAAAVLSRKEFRRVFRYFLFVSLVCSAGAALTYLGGLLLRNALDVVVFVLAANALVFAVWFVSSFLLLNYKFVKALPIAFLHPFFNVSFLFLWEKSGLIGTVISIGSPVVATSKLLFSALVILLSFGALFYILNAPAKRNFGISALQAVTLFFAQWVQGSKGLEEVLAEMGEHARTLVGVAVFRTQKKVKALFVVPCVHFGPFGNLGGSEFPFLIAKGVKARFGAEAFVFHATVNHDLNPVSSSSVGRMFTEIGGMVKSSNQFSRRGAFVGGKSGSSSVFGFQSGGKAFLSLSTAPHSCEDIDLATGTALRNKALSRFDDVLLVDRHNSLTDGRMFGVGNPEYYDYEAALQGMTVGKGGVMELGVSSDPLPEFNAAQGIGKAGLKVAAIRIDGKTACFVLIDGNNALPEFRERVVRALKPLGFDFCDLFTTDSHAVNNVGGVHNPVGLNCDSDLLLSRIISHARIALGDLEPVSVSFSSKLIDVHVMGVKMQSELMSTLNSIVSVAKIIAPIILAACIALVFLALVLL